MKRKKPKPTILSLRRELSAGEYQMLLSMLRGQGLLDSARAMGIPPSTAFDRRKAILRKSGVESQSELLSVLFVPFLPTYVRAEVLGK